MRVKLDPRWTKYLLQKPESGMGYQRVDIRFADGRELKNAAVFNAEDLELPDELADANISDVKLHVP